MYWLGYYNPQFELQGYPGDGHLIRSCSQTSEKWSDVITIFSELRTWPPHEKLPLVETDGALRYLQRVMA
jgi:hypothetical protein